MISKIVSQYHKVLIIGEVTLVFVISIVVSVVRLEGSVFQIIFSYPGQPKILLYPLIWYLFLYLNDSWDKSKLLNSTKFYSDIFDTAVKSLVLFAAIAYLISYPISRIWVLYNVVAIGASLIIFRFFIRKLLLSKVPPFEDFRYLYVGKKSELSVFMTEFTSLFGFKPKMDVLNSPDKESSKEWLETYKAKIESNYFGVVISYASISDAQLLKELANYNRDKVIDLILVSRISPIIKRFEILENPTLIKIRQSSLFASGAFLKRLIDIVGASMGLILLAPIFLITAIAIKLTSRGPILFTDRRIGKDGNVFTFPKFRSMIKGAEFKRAEFIGKLDSEISKRYKADPRITPFGRFIRRWSIDELPQLWCVLIGTMSLVGPRPILVEEADLIDPLHTERFLAKPGLTGLWQVTGRKEVAWEDRMLRDLAYIESWSISRDLVYIFKTVRAVWLGQGAY